MTANHSIDPAQFLSERLEHAEPDLLRAMLKTFIDVVLMGAEADALCGASYGARTEDRVNSDQRGPQPGAAWTWRPRDRSAAYSRPTIACCCCTAGSTGALNQHGSEADYHAWLSRA